MIVLKTVVDICGIDFCRPALKSNRNVIYNNPVKIVSAPSTSSFQWSYRSLQLFTHLNDPEISEKKQYFSDPLCSKLKLRAQTLYNQKNIF